MCEETATPDILKALLQSFRIQVVESIQCVNPDSSYIVAVM